MYAEDSPTVKIDNKKGHPIRSGCPEKSLTQEAELNTLQLIRPETGIVSYTGLLDHRN